MNPLLLALATVLAVDDDVGGFAHPLSEEEEAVSETVDGLIRELEDAAGGGITDAARWGTPLRKLAAVGPAAIPHIDEKLRSTNSDRLRRWLPFALRGIEDPRIIPVLIRAIPGLASPTTSGFGLQLVPTDEESKATLRFLQAHDTSPDDGPNSFKLGRPINEVFRPLREKTGQSFQSHQFTFVRATDDPGRRYAVQTLFYDEAVRWADWWNANASEFTDDPRYQHVTVGPPPEPLPENWRDGKVAKVVGRSSNSIVSPLTIDDEHADHFYDLDTGRSVRRADLLGMTPDEIDDWAAGEGWDLAGVVIQTRSGETFAIRVLGGKVWHLEPNSTDRLDELLREGEIPGEPFDDAIYEDGQHYMIESREGAATIITPDGQVTRLFGEEDLGRAVGTGDRSKGFSRGIRFSRIELGFGDP